MRSSWRRGDDPQIRRATDVLILTRTWLDAGVVGVLAAPNSSLDPVTIAANPVAFQKSKRVLRLLSR